MSSPNSPATKSVSFASQPLGPPPSSSSTATPSTPSTTTPIEASSPDSTTPSTTATSHSSSTPYPPPTTKPQPKRRRSSIKQGVQMPYKPPKEYYSHRDPLLRRLRLRNGFGTMVNLEQEFRDCKVVLFFFGATWRGSSQDPFSTVELFAKRNPHQLKVVYVSIDETEQAYEQNTRQKPWLAMEWNDGSNVSTHLATESSPLPPSPDPLEPFLLAGDPDLEEDLSLSDETGQVYLRPYSRVHLADRWTVLGVPNLVVYHVETRKVLSYHARFELLREGQMLGTWEKWSRGEKVTFGFNELIYALRWTLIFGFIASIYLMLVHSGKMPNYVADWSVGFTEKYLGNQAAAGKVEL